MSLQNNYNEWLKAGKQRAAVARVLRKPMTALEICDAARQWAPRLQLRDVWFLMRQMIDKNLALALNERSNNGRLYALTDAGRRAVKAAFGVSIPPLSESIDWKLYSWVVRSRTRKRVLLGMAQVEGRSPDGCTATQLYKHLRTNHLVGLNPVFHAVRDLAKKKLLICVGTTKVRACKIFRLSPIGNDVVELLLQ